MLAEKHDKEVQTDHYLAPMRTKEVIVDRPVVVHVPVHTVVEKYHNVGEGGGSRVESHVREHVLGTDSVEYRVESHVREHVLGTDSVEYSGRDKGNVSMGSRGSARDRGVESRARHDDDRESMYGGREEESRLSCGGGYGSARSALSGDVDVLLSQAGGGGRRPVSYTRM